MFVADDLGIENTRVDASGSNGRILPSSTICLESAGHGIKVSERRSPGAGSVCSRQAGT